ncbi:helix-turn-helix domain-containing protein [Streptomyces sp. NPDC127068]|uniref:helix-turn-helix domain-containing protein n=1 Tax=Streptomyces sp. NPDC127068 TaxID=3347127 RepID=UPI0036611AF9
MPAVARRTGVGVGSIYRYFPSKEALANAAFQHTKRDLLDRRAQSVPALPPPRHVPDHRRRRCPHRPPQPRPRTPQPRRPARPRKRR